MVPSISPVLYSLPILIWENIDFIVWLATTPNSASVSLSGYFWYTVFIRNSAVLSPVSTVPSGSVTLPLMAMSCCKKTGSTMITPSSGVFCPQGVRFHTDCMATAESAVFGKTAKSRISNDMCNGPSSVNTRFMSAE